MEKQEEQLLIDLTSARGIAGNEDEVREVFKNYAKDFADDIFFDGLGSVIAKHGGGGGPKVFISGHLDEVGFMVTKITEKGFLDSKSKTCLSILVRQVMMKPKNGGFVLVIWSHHISNINE